MDPTVALPSGTMTFLFTDIVGSTVRWELDPVGMTEALAEHDGLLRSMIGGNGGVVFSTGGDGFAAAFEDAASALGAAIAVQDHVRLPVRMGLHTGTADERDGNYFGRTLNRAARIMSTGHGGQIVLSDVTAGLVRDETEVTDLGEHRLVGVERLMHLWQVGGQQFPPLRTSTVVPGNLPTPLDGFVGRTQELDALSELMKRHRLVTVVGVGGMGKTRLMIEACHDVRSDAPAGVWFVDLALTQTDSAVVEQVASVFGLQAAPGRSIEERLIEHLEAMEALVVFDNCEHVVRPTARLVDRLLQASPMLRVVATSREALLLRGEHVMALGPLSMDDDCGEEPVDAVALFVERLTAEGGPSGIGHDDRAVALEICRQLDGMPLAIELAAARARTLGPSGVLARLGERLRLLSGGWRTGTGRQQTLSATLDWSFVLLDEREQVVFDRLAVFVGSFTLDDAVAVTRRPELDELDVLDALSGLVDKSMCAVDLSAAPARYRYLETMRSYGREHLSTSGELGEYRNRHAKHLATSAQRISMALGGPDELEASRQAERLAPDLRAALEWAVDQCHPDVIDAVATLARALTGRGSYEMSAWCYDLRDDVRDRPSVQASAAACAVFGKGDLVEARRLCDRLVESSGDRSSAAWITLSWVEFFEGHFQGAIECHMRGYAIGEGPDVTPTSHSINPALLAITLAVCGRDAQLYTEQAFARAQAARWPTGLAFAHYAAGLADGDPVSRLDAFDSAVARAREVGNRHVETLARRDRISLQWALLPRGELAVELTDLLQRLRQLGDTISALLTFGYVVALLNDFGRPRAAALICGWLDGRSGRSVRNLGDHEAAVAAIRRSLGGDWDELFDRGRSMTNNEVFDLACTELETIR